jgi:7-keto-8-aminopelargonate synthetase-like enzyme
MADHLNRCVAMPENSPTAPALLQARLRADLAERAALGRRRELRIAAPVRVNLADNDYLNLSNDESIKNAVRAALITGPVSAASSPLVRGYQDAHVLLEKTLCAWHGFPAGLVWNSGYAANQSVLGTLSTSADLIFADRLVHHSLIAGILQSGAKFLRFPHNDLDALEILLRDNPRPGGARWVITESVFSMDGDSPDLARLAEMKRRHGFLWMLDEAHALGWYGPHGQGRATETGVAADVDILIGTLGKTLGAMGAYSLFHDSTLR